MQYEWSIFDPDPRQAGELRIQHRALTDNYRQATTPRSKPTQTFAYAGPKKPGADLSDSAKLASLMLRSSLDLNGSGIVLFSSKNARHIEGNVKIASDDTLQEPATVLRALVRREGAKILGNSL